MGFEGFVRKLAKGRIGEEGIRTKSGAVGKIHNPREGPAGCWTPFPGCR